jgi:hypothetical protein
MLSRIYSERMKPLNKSLIFICCRSLWIYKVKPDVQVCYTCEGYAVVACTKGDEWIFELTKIPYKQG